MSMSNEINKVHEAIVVLMMRFGCSHYDSKLIEDIGHCGVLVDEPDEDGDFFVSIFDVRAYDINDFVLELAEIEKFRFWKIPNEVVIVQNGAYVNVDQILDDNPKIKLSSIYSIIAKKYNYDHPFSRLIQDSIRLELL